MPAKNKKNKTDASANFPNEECLELLHAREVICSRLSRFQTFLGNNKGELFQIEVRLKSIEEDFSEFDKIQTRLEFLSQSESDNRLDTESAFYFLISEAKQLLAEQNQSKINVMTPHVSRAVATSPLDYSPSAKLPDIGLPSFFGNYESWFSFKDIFESIVNKRTDLSIIDKFLYLKLCCKGDALRLIESLEVTTDNYSIALSLLEKRYENKRAVINFHVNSILFKLPNVVKESAFHIRKLIDTVHQHKMALEKLKLPVQHWDALLIPIILQKLDERTIREWENKQSNDKLSQLSDLLEFLTRKCCALESTNQVFNKPSYNKSDSNSNKDNHERSGKLKQVVYQVAQTSRCCICNESHFIYNCPRFASLSISDKYSEIQKNKLCSNCLRSGHLKNQCKSSACKKCNFKHYTLLHVNHHSNLNSQGSNNNSSGNVATHDVIPVSHGTQLTRLPPALNAIQRLDEATSEATNGSEGRPKGGRAPTMLVIDRNFNMDSQNTDNSFEVLGKNNINSTEFQTEEKLVISQSASYSNLERNQILLSTATILIQDKNGIWQECNALLDSGSQSNLITTALCNKLKLSLQKIDLPLSGVNQVITKVNYRTRSKIKSRFNQFIVDLSFLVLPVLTEKLPIENFDLSSVKYPKNINLADKQFNVSKEIDVLLGAGIFYDLLLTGKIRLGNNMPTLQQTVLGWIFTGQLSFNNFSVNKISCNLLSTISNKELHDSLTKFWQIEEFENRKHLSKEERYCEDYFKQSTTRTPDGKFVVRYPFEENIEKQLGDSKTIALRRLGSLERRLNKDQHLKGQYFEFMKEYELLGHMSLKCNLDQDKSVENISFFLPHSAVLRDSITTKCRVVFDASSKSTTNVSLNDLLLVGPTIQEELFAILLRVRLGKIVISADIKMMYRCIDIAEEERGFQQILWRWNQNEPVKVYTLNTVTYGTSSAPFQATRCLKELAILNKDKYNRTSKIIEKCFYMDDLLLSVQSEDEALEIYHEISEILSQASFKLRKWSSNSKSFLNKILQINSNVNDEKLVLFQSNKELKPLGVIWDSNHDILKYSVNTNLEQSRITKRSILSIMSKLFDPLGLIGPAIIKAKLIMQELWRLRLGWDDDVPSNIKNNWLIFTSEINYLNEIRIDRCVLNTSAVSVELYGFSDSSEKAYGACIYACSVDTAGNREIKLLTAKSKVAPIKKLTLPRLELLAAHLLAKLMFKIINILDIKASKITYFSDSTIVLSWLKIEPSNLKTFVANRVAKINELSDISDWNYVASKDNAADIISRGLNPKDLVNNKLWFEGPTFLRHHNIFHFKPCNEVLDSSQIKNLPEIKSQSISLNLLNTNLTPTKNTNQETIIHECDIFRRYSSLPKLQRIIGYICRFKNRTLKQVYPVSNVLTVEELKDALSILIRQTQRESFNEEIVSFKKSNRVPTNSRILNLNPFLDREGVLRVGGRLSNSNLSHDQKHPIILPYKHPFTDLVILAAHRKHLHAGTQNLLSIIRLQFWPVKGKSAVKRVIDSCIKCYRANPKTVKFLMGSLPNSRVTPCRPFTNTGVDYAGPIYVKEGTLRNRKLVKTYICIFICFATRAVHVELANNLETQSFLNCLKRFCSRRGKPSNIYSDNGLNFVGANNYFSELNTLINDKKHNESVSFFLAEEQIKWHFNPGHSPHMGGLWEAAVKSAKFHLHRVLGQSSLHYEELYTLLVQIEACLNSRPLTALSDDINDFLPLTPSHFLIGDSLVGLPEEDVLEVNPARLNRYQHLVQMYQQFWNRWSNQYLSSLQARSKWLKDQGAPLKIGSLVVLVEENTPPLRWPMGRITELHPGPDNIVRVVSVRLISGTVVRRAVSKVCLLPIEPSGSINEK